MNNHRAVHVEISMSNKMGNRVDFAFEWHGERKDLPDLFEFMADVSYGWAQYNDETWKEVRKTNPRVAVLKKGEKK